MSGPTDISAQELIAQLDAHADASDKTPLVAFDADGTLWSGDVGEDLFEQCLADGLLRDEATEALAAMAVAHGLDPEDDANTIGKQLLAAHRSGTVPNLPAYEMMTWAYAGWPLSELRDYAVDVLRAAGHTRRRQQEVARLVEWATDRSVAVAVVSASPLIAVDVGLELLDLAFDHVAAGEPKLSDGHVQPGMASPLPYGPTKTTRARALFGDVAWLASFGDSDYDLDLLLAAKVGVLVRPKPGLLRVAKGRSSLVRLERPRRSGDSLRPKPPPTKEPKR